MEQFEQFFVCPHCGESISILLDLSVLSQKFIEDCEVCCRPIEIKYEVGEDGEVVFEEGRS
jgi:transcription elongation factor Elf1